QFEGRTLLDKAGAPPATMPAKPTAANAAAASGGAGPAGGGFADRPPQTQPLGDIAAKTGADALRTAERAKYDAESAKKARQRLEAREGAPASLYFNPHLPTDE